MHALMFVLTRSSVVIISVSIIMLYFSHRALRMQHFRYCNRDLLRISFLDKSFICSNVAKLLNVIESMVGCIIHNSMVSTFALLGTFTSTLVTSRRMS